MGMTSRAEAELDARIRPEIALLRSRTPYPRRRRAGAAGSTAESTAGTAGSTAESAAGSTAGTAGSTAGRTAAGAAASAQRPGAARPARPASPIRLTRRGRVVVSLLLLIGVTLLAGLLWLALGGQARASSHLPGGAASTRGMLRVVVRPGQTLWSIAVKADPTVDPRIVIGEIIEDNGLTGTTIAVGQTLWVPRG